MTLKSKVSPLPESYRRLERAETQFQTTTQLTERDIKELFDAYGNYVRTIPSKKVKSSFFRIVLRRLFDI